MPAYRRKPIIDTAVRDAISGHWVVTIGGGETFEIADADFRAAYEPVGKEGRLMMLAKHDDGQLATFDPDEPIIVRHPAMDASYLQSLGLVPTL